jgi:rhodanese-related sulfurtransferase
MQVNSIDAAALKKRLGDNNAQLLDIREINEGTSDERARKPFSRLF